MKIIGIWFFNQINGIQTEMQTQTRRMHNKDEEQGQTWQVLKII